MEDAIVLTYDISADDFTRAGEASSDVKRKLKQMGVDPEAIRKVAIAMYEGEINMVIHAKGGLITVEITPQQIKMILADVGPGIPDVELAMQAGYSTAPDEIRSLGFNDYSDAYTMAGYVMSEDVEFFGADPLLTEELLKYRADQSLEYFTALFNQADFPLDPDGDAAFPESFSYTGGSMLYFSIPVPHALGDYALIQFPLDGK